MTSLMNPPQTEANTGPLTRFRDIPRWAKLVLYLAMGVAILSLTRIVTGAGQLTAENTLRSAL